MMQRLELDFVATPRSPWAARLVLLVSLAVAGDMAFTFVSFNRANSALETRLAELGPKALQAAKPVSSDELAAARDTAQRLSLPWSKLFAALEGAASDQVALLAIEPDPRAGTVSISGDSKDYLAALTYVLNLSRADSLSHVTLVRHETKQNDPQRPVAFTVSASWGMK
jgi:Tfp pilus assembly protein PilN